MASILAAPLHVFILKTPRAQKTWQVVKILVLELHLDLMPSSPRFQPRGGRRCRKEDLLAWNREYQQKGRIWRGAAPKLPDLPPGSMVLELGCGNGKTLAAMMRRPWRIAALDLSPLAVRLGEKIATTLEDAPSEADLLAADVADLPFKDSVFDAVFAFHVIGHLREGDRCRAAGEAARVLKADGHLFFLEFEVEDMRGGKGEEVEPSTFRRGGGVLTHYFSEGEVLDLFDMLRPASIRTDRRPARIRGQNHVRAEVGAEFFKG
jgi:SAM-dependent methyltransferase